MPNLLDLSLADTAVTDAGLAHLRGLARLLELDLTGTAVTAGGVVNLQAVLPNCRIVAGPSAERAAAEATLMRGGGVTIRTGGQERVLPVRSALPPEPFQFVAVSHWGSSHTGDDSLKHLRALPHLQSINLHGTHLTDLGLRYLNDLPDLISLVLAETMVTDGGLVQLGRFPNLIGLHLVRTRIGTPVCGTSRPRESSPNWCWITPE